MAEYHVGCGIAGIYAGTLKKNGIEWLNKSEVTDEAIEAVRDYMYGKLKIGGNFVCCSWRLKDGRVVKLMLKVIPAEQEGEE